MSAFRSLSGAKRTLSELSSTSQIYEDEPTSRFWRSSIGQTTGLIGCLCKCQALVEQRRQRPLAIFDMDLIVSLLISLRASTRTRSRNVTDRSGYFRMVALNCAPATGRLW